MRSSPSRGGAAGRRIILGNAAMNPNPNTDPSSTPTGAEPAESRHRRREEAIDAELAQSFPASDPPSWVQSTLGGALDQEDAR